MELLDQIFEVLSEERRRYALYYLEQKETAIPVEELIEQVAEWEAGRPAESIPDEKFDRIGIEFYHHELPKATDLQYVRYNPDEGLVELTGLPPEVGAIISIAKVIERPERNP